MRVDWLGPEGDARTKPARKRVLRALLASLALAMAAPHPATAQQCYACQCAGSFEAHPVVSQEDCGRGCYAWGIICATERYLFEPDYTSRFGRRKLRVPGGGNFSPFYVSSCPDGIYFGAGTLIGPDRCPRP